MMTRWSEPGPGWEPILNGKPARSSYFWMAFLFTFQSLLGIAKMAARIEGIHHEIALWAPTLVGFVLILALAGAGAIRAVDKARSGGTDALKRVAFEKFRTYFYCAALVAVATGLMMSFIG